jgi:WD40 repeat protein
MSLAFSPDSAELAGGASTGEVVLWDTRAEPIISGPPASLVVQGPAVGTVEQSAFSADGTWLATAGSGPRVAVQDLDSHTVLTLTTPAAVRSLRFSPDGRYLAVEHEPDGAVTVWEPTGRLVRTLAASQDGHLAFSPDGQTLAQEENTLIHLWPLAGGDALTLAEPCAECQALAFSPDGRTLAAAGAQSLVVWDLAAHSAGVIPFATGDETRLVFNPAGDKLAFRVDGVLGLLTVATGQTMTLTQAAARVDGLTFSPDGATLAVWGRGSAVLWEPATYRSMQLPIEINGGVQALAFRPDRSTLRAVTADPVHYGAVRVQTTAAGIPAMLAAACATANRNFTAQEWAKYGVPEQPIDAICPDAPAPP